MIPFAIVRMSGTTPSCSTANVVPVRPKPVATSSQTRSAPCRSQISRIRRTYPGGWAIMPSAPCITGSRTSAAIFPGRAANSSSTSSAHAIAHDAGSFASGQR